jgi:lipid-binding SYLF domain-containing protein
MTKLRAALAIAVSIALGSFAIAPGTAIAGGAAQIDSDVDAALASLYASNPAAKTLGAQAKGILVFPQVLKAGLLIGGHYGEGALRVNGKSPGYFYTSAVSYGLQAGGQTYGYALFFMTDNALDYLEDSGGWEIGVGPSVVVVDQGTAKTITTTTQLQEVYAFIFNQQGLMAGLGLQGSKIGEFIPR